MHFTEAHHFGKVSMYDQFTVLFFGISRTTHTNKTPKLSVWWEMNVLSWCYPSGLIMGLGNLCAGRRKLLPESDTAILKLTKCNAGIKFACFWCLIQKPGGCWKIDFRGCWSRSHVLSRKSSDATCAALAEDVRHLYCPWSKINEQLLQHLIFKSAPFQTQS